MFSSQEIGYQWFPARITGKTGSGTSARYSWVRRWVEGSGSVGNMPNAASGNATSGDLAGVCLTGADLAVGDDVMARAAPGAGGVLYELVPVGGSSGGGGGGNAPPQDCGAFAGLHANICLIGTTSSNSSQCSGISGQTLRLTNDGGDWNDDIATGLGSTTLHFHPGNSSTFGNPVCWLDEFSSGEGTIPATYLTLSDCGGGDLTFKGGYPVCPLGEEDEPTCPPGTFSVTIRCGECPNANYTGPGWYCVAKAGTCGNTASQGAEEFTDDPGSLVILCSGPYGNQTAALAVCPDPEPIEAICCPDGVTIPSVLYATFTAASGVGECLLGSVIVLTHTVVGGIDVWYGCVGGACSGISGSVVRLALWCYTEGSQQLAIDISCGGGCFEPTAYSGAAHPFTTGPFSYTHTFSGFGQPCGNFGSPASWTVEITE